MGRILHTLTGVVFSEKIIKLTSSYAILLAIGGTEMTKVAQDITISFSSTAGATVEYFIGGDHDFDVVDELFHGDHRQLWSKGLAENEAPIGCYAELLTQYCGQPCRIPMSKFHKRTKISTAIKRLTKGL